MERIKNDTWERLLGYGVGRELKEMVLNEIKETGQAIEQVVSKYALPTLITLEDDGTFWDNGKHYTTTKEWEQDSPLKEYSKLVVYGTEETMALHDKLNNKVK